MGAEDFVKLSVNCRSDFAFTDLSEKAELAFYRGLVYCGLNNTAGNIPRRDLPDLGPRRVADELVAKDYWETTPTGWAYRSWDKWQGDLEIVNERRKRDAERMREWRRKKRLDKMEDGNDAA
jgi:hypothetical protein